MNLRLRLFPMLAAFLGMTLIGSGEAWAGDNRHHDKHGHGGHHYYKKHDRGHRYGHRYRGHYANPGRHYRRYDSDDDEKLLYGLLVGGLFGYVVGNANQVDSSTYNNYPPQNYSSQNYPQPAAQYSSNVATTCLQEREYQMKVMVGGKEVDAYGTACLQPDGSWLRGPAQLVPR